MRKLTYLLSLLILWGMIATPLQSGAQEKFPKGQEKYEPYVQNPNFTLNRSTVFSENFDSWPPVGWTITQLGTSLDNWSLSANTYAGAGAAFHDDFSGDHNSWLISPAIELDAGSEYILIFYERNLYVPSWYDYSGVLISEGSGVAGHVDFIEVYESNLGISSYTQKQIDLTSYAGKTIYIAFVYQGDWAHRWWVDEVNIAPPPPPEFSIDPENWDFGFVAAGASADKVFTIQNAGSGTLIVSSLAIQNVIAATGEFSITDQPASIELEGGETAEITITFAPNSPGDRSANLVISTAEDEHIIPLNGSGIDLTGLYFSQGPSYANGRNSTVAPGFNLISADNFWNVQDEITSVALTVLFTGATINPVEPFYIRFYEYVEAYVPGLEAPVTGTYYLALKDSWGDGWNGGKVSLSVNGIEALTEVTMLGGAGPVYFEFTANAGDEISTVYVPGNWSSENYYAIMTEEDNPASILAEQGGTWDSPGFLTPGSILPGGMQAIEPEWNAPVVSQNIMAELIPVGTTFAGYDVYKISAVLPIPVDMVEGWLSAQYDGMIGAGTNFFWLPGLDGDGLSYQRIESTQIILRGEQNPYCLSSEHGKETSRDLKNDDRAFELIGPSTLIPISNWALYLGILLMITFVVIRFRRMI